MNAFLSRSRGAAAAAVAAAAALLLGSAGARAGDFTLSGSIAFHNDVVQIDFSLAADAADVRIWTDSWQSGLNFDPTGALWVRSGRDFTLLQAVDDDDTVGPDQGFYDVGFALPLAAGAYRLTLAAAINEPAGTLLSQGFGYDAETPIPIGQWDQPSFDPNANDQKGGFWRLQLSNVDQVSPVPEPSSWLSMGLGLAFCGVVVARDRKRRASRPDALRDVQNLPTQLA